MIEIIFYYFERFLLFILFYVICKIIYRIFTINEIENTIYCAKTKENQKKLSKIDKIKSFHPSPLLINGHLQTMFFQVFRSYPHNEPMSYARDSLSLPDGGRIILDWTSKDFSVNIPTVILCHGVCGGSQCDYIQWQIEALLVRGFRCVVMNQRGCNDNYLQTPVPFSACSTIEIRTAVNYIKSVLPAGTPLHAIGFSLGCNYLTLYLGEEVNHCPFTSVILQSPPVYSHVLQHEKTTVSGKFYSLLVAENLKMLLNKSEAIKESPLYSDICSSHSICQLDESLFAPSCGLSVEEYRQKSDIFPSFLQAQCPVLVLVSYQDPCCYPYRFKDSEKEISANPNLMVVITEEGGHLAWGSDFFPSGCSWSDDVTGNWLTYHSSVTAH